MSAMFDYAIASAMRKMPISALDEFHNAIDEELCRRLVTHDPADTTDLRNLLDLAQRVLLEVDPPKGEI